MRTKIKRLTTIIALLLLCAVFLSCMSGCAKKDSNRFDTDLFCCMYNEDKTGVIVLSLTQKGQEQEVLVIPEEIKGLPIVQLGGETGGYPNARQHTFKSEKLKKLYVCFTNHVTAEEELPNLSEIFILNENAFYSLAINSSLLSLNNCSEKTKFFTTQELYGKYQDEITENNNPKREYKVADIIYYKQEGSGLFACWIDDSTSKQQKVVPFLQSSIYRDSDYSELWDGTYDNISEDGLLLYVKD